MVSPLCSRVTRKDEDDMSVSSDSLGEQLFELVDVYNTGHSQKITGKKQTPNVLRLEYHLERKQRTCLFLFFLEHFQLNSTSFVLNLRLFL